MRNIFDTRQKIYRVPEKEFTAKMALPALVCHLCFTVCNTRQSFGRVQNALCRVVAAHSTAAVWYNTYLLFRVERKEDTGNHTRYEYTPEPAPAVDSQNWHQPV
jgi:hypothetical protein